MKQRVSPAALAWSLVGTVVGAGYASGQEIYQFFVRYGEGGIIGIPLSALLFSVVFSQTIRVAQETGTNNWRDLLGRICPPIVALLLEGTFFLSLFTGVSIMLAGSGAVLSDSFAVPVSWGIGATALVVIGALLFQIRGLAGVNQLLMPLLFFGVALLAIIYLPRLTPFLFSSTLPIRRGWAFSALLYVAYNLIPVVAVLAGMSDKASQRTARQGAFWAGVCLGLMSLAIALPLYLLPKIGEIPILQTIIPLGAWPRVFYTVAVWAAMMTTALANGYGIAVWVMKQGVPYGAGVVLTVLASLPLAGWKFSELVRKLYPLYGYAGLVFLFFLFLPRKIIVVPELQVGRVLQKKREKNIIK